ncbi:MAG: hypothetical protein ACI4GX_08075 [Ruminococcus sp.]
MEQLEKKHDAICKQFDKKKNILDTYRALSNVLYQTIIVAEENKKSDRYEIAFNTVKIAYKSIKDTEDETNDKQK